MYGDLPPTETDSNRWIGKIPARNVVVPRYSEQPYVTFGSLDHVVHLSAPYLFGKAKGEAFGCAERNMRR